MLSMSRCPTHPGEILREDSLPALGLSVVAFARALGVSRQMVHGLLAERYAVSPEMAVRLGALFGNGPQLWMDMQTRRDVCASLPPAEQAGLTLWSKRFFDDKVNKLVHAASAQTKP